jgi:gliding motility-associated-like protein
VSDASCNTSNTGTVSVTVNINKPHIVIDPKHLCIDDTVKLTTSLFYNNWLWNTGQTTSGINVLTSGIYSVTTTDINGCKGSDSLTVHAYTHVPMVPGSGTICAGQSFMMTTATGTNFTYEWFPPGGLSDPHVYNPITTPESTTVYTISITNGPCVSKNTFTVHVNPTPPLTVTASSDLVISGEDVQLIGVSNTTCYWYPNNWLSCMLCDTTISTPEDHVLYFCSVMNEFGCINTKTVEINIIPTFYVPNSFTPDEDGVNDIWRPVFTGYVELAVSIYDRWGALIYYYNTLEGGWNGTYKGVLCEQAVYTYKLSAKDYSDHIINRVGHITLLKNSKR